MSADEHCIGRLVDDLRFQIESTAVSANHCKIYRKVIVEDVERTSVFLKDTRLSIVHLFSDFDPFLVIICIQLVIFSVQMEHILIGGS